MVAGFTFKLLPGHVPPTARGCIAEHTKCGVRVVAFAVDDEAALHFQQLLQAQSGHEGLKAVHCLKLFDMEAGGHAGTITDGELVWLQVDDDGPDAAHSPSQVGKRRLQTRPACAGA